MPNSTKGKVVDLSHTIFEGLITYPGLPAPVITPHLTRIDSIGIYAAGTTFAMDLITMIGNTGTYIDSPFHRYEAGADLSQLSLDTLVGLRARVFHLVNSENRGIEAEVFHGFDLRGTAVLLHTGWDEHFGQPHYGKDAPFLTRAAAEYLIGEGVLLVGIDSVNIDDTQSGGERPAHTLFLGAGIHVVEHLTNLGQVPESGAEFTAVPPKIKGFGTFPVRAFVVIPAS